MTSTASQTVQSAIADTISPSILMRLLANTIPAQINTLIVGPPGIGKTEILIQAAKEQGFEAMISHPVVSDPTDAKGLPWPDAATQTARWLPFGDLQRALTTEVPLVWFLDDLGQATPAVQAAYMQLILGRQINGHKIKDHVSFVAATNRRTDRSGVTGILEAVKSRFGVIVHLHPNPDDWHRWATTAGIAPEIRAFLRFKRGLLFEFNPKADIVNQPSPRTWKFASDIIKKGMEKELELIALAGAVGAGAAHELEAYLRVYRDLPDLDSILVNPKKAIIPDNLAARYAVSVGLADKANANNFDRVLTYAERLCEARNGAEFAVLLIRDCDRKDSKIQHTAAWTKMCADTEIGKLIVGEED